MSEESQSSSDAASFPDHYSSHNSTINRILDFLGSRPKLCLFLLTPSIVEYFSGSSPLYLILTDPFVLV